MFYYIIFLVSISISMLLTPTVQRHVKFANVAKKKTCLKKLDTTQTLGHKKILLSIYFFQACNLFYSLEQAHNAIKSKLLDFSFLHHPFVYPTYEKIGFSLLPLSTLLHL